MCDNCNQTERAYPGAGSTGELRAAQQKRQADMSNSMPARPMTDEEVIARIFSYIPPTELTSPKFTAVRQAGKHFAEIILANCPPGSDRMTVINCIREAVMFANASISLSGQTF